VVRRTARAQFGTLLGMQSPCWQEAAEAKPRKAIRHRCRRARVPRGRKRRLRWRAGSRSPLLKRRRRRPRRGSKRKPPAPGGVSGRAFRGCAVRARPRSWTGVSSAVAWGVEADVPPGFRRRPRPARRRDRGEESPARKRRASLLFVPEAVTPEVVDTFFPDHRDGLRESGGRLRASSCAEHSAPPCSVSAGPGSGPGERGKGTGAVLRVHAGAGLRRQGLLRGPAPPPRTRPSRSALERFVGSAARRNGAADSPPAPICSSSGLGVVSG